MDATCVPSDIRYPTDLSLLNEAREKLEGIIDILHKPHRGERKKVRTYRQKARGDYLNVAKMRKPSMSKLRKGIRKQLQYIARNVRYINGLQEETSLQALSNRQYQDLLVIQELYRQQKKMYQEKTHTVDSRIVSIAQPYVRPIVRGKSSAEVEFGAKISVALVDGYAFLERLSWDNYNESTDLLFHIEQYKKRFGCYPASAHVDRIFRTRKNREECKTRGIRLSGPALGRPPKDKEAYKRMLDESRQDEKDRIPIEGTFGNGKRKYGLGRITAKLKKTSETTIGMIILVMNLEKLLRDFLLSFFRFLLGKCMVL